MPPKKRAAPSATTPAVVKRSKASEVILKPHLTTRNATSSPLLRLPAELREVIWKYAYSDMMVMVQAYIHQEESGETDEPRIDLIYDVYDKIFTGQFIQDAQDARSRPPSLVCRQFWAEASRVFLDYCALRVPHPEAILALVATKQVIVQYARKLVIVYEMYDLLDGLRDWANVLNFSTIGRFRNLEGFELHFWIGFFKYWGLTTDFMNHGRWKKAKLPHIVRAFQQHKLENPLFQIHIDDGFDLPDDWLAEFNEAVRKELLDHRPRRVSRRVRT